MLAPLVFTSRDRTDGGSTRVGSHAVSQVGTPFHVGHSWSLLSPVIPICPQALSAHQAQASPGDASQLMLPP